jgi:hypothetical protein
MGMRLYGLTPTTTSDPWYESYRESAESMGLIGIHEYTIRSTISRGQAAELILRIRDYAKTKSVKPRLSLGCSSGKSLSTTNTLAIA